MYKNFGYPLHSVVAGLEVIDDIITVRHLTGLGPTDDRLHRGGTIDGTGDDAGGDLRLTSDDIGLDDALLAALPESTETGLRTLFDQEAAARLRRAGLLPAQAAIDRELALLPLLQEERPLFLDDPTRLARIDADIRRLRILAEDGPFQVGGEAIDLHIHRPRIEEYPVAVEGPIELRDVGGVFSRFPYPLRVRRGRILLEDLAVVLQEPGFEVTTISGGEGFIAGRVDLPRDGRGSRDVHPELTLRIRERPAHPRLLAPCLPISKADRRPRTFRGWPGEVRSPAVDPVLAMGLRGPGLHGRDPDRRHRRRPVRGHRQPHEWNGESGRDRRSHGRRCRPAVAARLRPQRRPEHPRDRRRGTGTGVVHRRAGRGRCSRGHYDFQSEIGRGIARLRNLEMEELLLDLVPAGSLEEARSLWRRWDLSGRFNADLHWSRRRSETELDLEAEPLWAEFETAAGRTRFDRERGRIRFHDGWIEVDDLALKLATGDRIDGALRLDGYGFEELPASRVLEGVLGQPLDSRPPAVEEVLRLSAGDALANWWLERARRTFRRVVRDRQRTTSRTRVRSRSRSIQLHASLPPAIRPVVGAVGSSETARSGSAIARSRSALGTGRRGGRPFLVRRRGPGRSVAPRSAPDSGSISPAPIPRNAASYRPRSRRSSSTTRFMPRRSRSRERSWPGTGCPRERFPRRTRASRTATRPRGPFTSRNWTGILAGVRSPCDTTRTACA